MPKLSGRAAIVTGSTKGIGLAVAEALAEAGADVVISSRTAAEVEEVAGRLDGRPGGRVVGIPCDVRHPERCAEMVERAVEELGRLDIVVNNAGIGIFGSIRELSVEDWQKQIETNLGGVYYLSKAAVPHLVESGDAWIINIGSLAGRNSFAGGTGYNASKFGLLGMSEAMMLDLRHDGIRVSVIMPGSVDTSFSHPGGEDSKPWALTADDVARAVLQLIEYPGNAHVSRVEMRPSQPPRK